MLRGEKIDPKELDEIVRALRQLEDERVYQTSRSWRGCRRSSPRA